MAWPTSTYLHFLGRTKGSHGFGSRDSKKSHQPLAPMTRTFCPALSWARSSVSSEVRATIGRPAACAMTTAQSVTVY